MKVKCKKCAPALCTLNLIQNIIYKLVGHIASGLKVVENGKTRKTIND